MGYARYHHIAGMFLVIGCICIFYNASRVLDTSFESRGGEDGESMVQSLLDNKAIPPMNPLALDGEGSSDGIPDEIVVSGEAQSQGPVYQSSEFHVSPKHNPPASLSAPTFGSIAIQLSFKTISKLVFSTPP